MLKSEWKELPDYKNPDDYKFVVDASPSFMAWEFLRRDEKYRNDWSAFVQMRSQEPTKSGLHFDVRRVSASEQFYKSAASKWGISHLADPFKLLPAGVAFIRNGITEIIDDVHLIEMFMEETVTEQGIQILPNILALAVDASRPLNELLDEFTDQVRRKQLSLSGSEDTQSYRNKPKLWKRHLRLLDARRANPQPTFQEIGTFFGLSGVQGEKKLAEKQYDLAKDMSANGYRKILMMR